MIKKFSLLMGILALPVAGCATFSPGEVAALARPSIAEVGVDERVELLAIIFRLAGAEEYSNRQLAIYTEAIETHFGQFRSHPAVLAAKELRERHGISHNAVAEIAVHLTPFPELRERVDLTGSQLDHRWSEEIAAPFLEKVRAFAADTNAARFFAQQRPLYTLVERRARYVAESEASLKWVRDYYGGNQDARLFVVPALGNGSFAYGPRFYGGGAEREFYVILNIWQMDEDLRPAVPVSSASTMVHELSHSYVTPLVLEKYDELRPAGEQLLRTFEPQMRALAYTEAATVIHESIIRAMVARFKLAHAGEAAARRELLRQRQQGFLWIEELYDLLGTYEQNRTRFPTIRDFYPVLRDYFLDLARRAPAVAAAYEAQRPRVVEFTPANGSTNVDPATTTVTFRFDRPMSGSMGFRRLPDPENWTAKSAVWDESRRLLTVTIDLEPSRRYEFDLLPQFNQSADGIPVGPTTLVFTTGPARLRR